MTEVIYNDDRRPFIYVKNLADEGNRCHFRLAVVGMVVDTVRKNP